MSLDRRKHKRYSVENIVELRGEIESHSAHLHLLTLGTGGCGFWSADQAKSRLAEGQTVRCILGIEGKNPIQVSGEVIYLKPQPFQGQVGKFIGVKFLENDLSKLKPLIEELELLLPEEQLEAAAQN